MIRILISLVSTLAFVACSSVTPNKTNQHETASQPDSCNSPDANINCCFVSTPENLSHVMNITGGKDNGEKLILTGRVFRSDGITPYSGVIIYAYHTNKKGLYAKTGNETGIQRWHGINHGWCKTDTLGHYEIHTTRPASYPNSNIPAHIHAAIKLPDNKKPFYINDFVFTDDPFVTEHYRLNLPYQTGDAGIIELIKSDGVWFGKRSMVLDNL